MEGADLVTSLRQAGVNRGDLVALVVSPAIELGLAAGDGSWAVAGVAAEVGGGGAAVLKKLVTTAVNDLLAPVRARRAEYERDLGYVRQVLRDGNQRANEIAAVTLAEVQTAMGMRY